MQKAMNKPGLILLLFVLIVGGTMNCKKKAIDEFIEPPAMPRPIRSIAYFGKEIVWVATETGIVNCTLNAGDHWQDLYPPGKVRLVDFINERQGWAVTNQSKILRTSNGGFSWNRIGELGSADDPHQIPVTQLKFIDENLGFALDYFTLWETKNGGLSWHKNPLSDKSSCPLECLLINPETFHILGTGGTVWRSTDRGDSWVRNDAMPLGTDIRALFFLNHQTGWLATIDLKDGKPINGIYRTDDGGESWRAQKLPEGEITIKSIHFINEKAGWAVGNERVLRKGMDSYGRAIALRTHTGGETWEVATISPEEIFYEKVYFIDENYGWLSSSTALHHTTDSGNSWKTVLTMSAK
jgi:photosystem II stability/assembly factor-like uncharacterized protein